MILHNNSHNMCFISNIVQSQLSFYQSSTLMFHSSITNTTVSYKSTSLNWTALLLSQFCLCSVLYSCLFNYDSYIKVNHKNTGTMYSCRPCLSHLLHFKPMNAHNCIRVTIILQKPLKPICFGPYWPITWEYNNCIKQLFNILIISCMQNG